jgi:hypothetical protein
MDQPLRMLFAGYAPVHFVCFRPIYEQLVRQPGIDLRVSGGLRTHSDGERNYDLTALYAPFSVEADRMLTVEEIGEMDFDVLFTANTKPLEPRSVGRRISLVHGISFRNRAVRKEKKGRRPDHFFVAGPYQLRAFRFRKIVSQRDPRVVKVGFPKTDPLLDGSLDRDQILSQYGFGNSRPVLLYAPTGAEGNSLFTMGEEFLRLLIATGQYDILIKPHDHSHDGVDWFDRLAPLEDAHTRLVRDADVIPAMFAADLLITDASSVSNEFALLDRPMVFLDCPKLLLSEISKGGLIDLDTWGRKAGLLARKPQEGVDAVAAALAEPDRFSKIRRRMVADLFYNPGTATEAALTWLRENDLLPTTHAQELAS